MEILALNKKRLYEAIQEVIRKRDFSENLNAIIEIYLSHPIMYNLERKAMDEDTLLASLRKRGNDWVTEENIPIIRSFSYMLGTSMSMAPQILFSLSQLKNDKGEDLLPIDFLTELLEAVMDMKRYDKSFYDLPFLKDISTKEDELKDGYLFGYITCWPYRFVNDGDLRECGGKFVHSIGVFSEETKIPAIINVKNANTEKQSVGIEAFFPSVVNVADTLIDKAAGKVLIIGSEWGYLEYLAVQKDNVESVTVIEEDEEKRIFMKNRFYDAYKNKEKIISVPSVSDEDIKNYNSIFIMGILPVEEFFKYKRLKSEYGLNINIARQGECFELVKSLVIIALGEISGEFAKGHVIVGDEIEDSLQIVKEKLKDYKIKSPDDINKLLSNKTLDELF